MKETNVIGVPDYEYTEFEKRNKDYVLLIPVINEGQRIIDELKRAYNNHVHDYVDIVVCDGGSTDGSLENNKLISLKVNTLLVKTGQGKQGAQLRMGFYWAKKREYKGIITIDGNNKDSIEDVPLFIERLEEGYDFVQGSRFIKGGEAINTPKYRLLAIKLLHAPLVSLSSGFHYTDTTSAYRGYSVRFLYDKRTDIFRDIFNTYELLAYLSIKAPKLGYKVCEIPVKRFYPKNEAVPTKISPIKGNINLFKILLNACVGKYDPK